MQEELALVLGVTRQAISKRFHPLGMIQKQGTWVPYNFKPRGVDAFELSTARKTATIRAEARKSDSKHDNARPHTAKPVETYLETLKYAPYSPGLADQQFRSYEEIEKRLHSWITSKDEHFYRNYIRALPERWAKGVANDGQYFE